MRRVWLIFFLFWGFGLLETANSGISLDPLIEKHINILQGHTSRSSKGRAIQKLGEYGSMSSPSIPILIPYLGDDKLYQSWGIRFRNKLAQTFIPLGGTHLNTMGEEAAYTLYKIGDSSVIPLCEAMSSTSTQIRRNASYALQMLKNPKSTDILIHVLKDSDTMVRFHAIIGLGEIGDPKAISPLKELIKDSDISIRSNALQSISRIKSPLSEEILVELAMNSDPKLRSESLESLGHLGKREYIPVVVKALNDTDWSVRFSATQALGFMKDSTAIDPLIEGLRDKEPAVRMAANTSLLLITRQNFNQDYQKALEWRKNNSH